MRRLILAGAVRVAGRPLRAPGRDLPSGTRLEVDVDLGRLPPVRPAEPAVLAVAVLYEDAFLIAVDKPPGIPTVPTADPSRAHLAGLVVEHLRARPGHAGEPYLGVHQRLDRDTSGVVLFVKDRAANASLAAAFAEGRVRKTYAALTVRPPRVPPPAWRVDAPIARAGRGRMAADPAGAPARTEFRLVETLARALVVEARPRTGRTHQVRVHLAASGVPILGDATYGGAGASSPRAPRVMLHATALELRHPVTGAALRIDSPEPADFHRLRARLRALTPQTPRK